MILNLRVMLVDLRTFHVVLNLQLVDLGHDDFGACIKLLSFFLLFLFLG